MKKFFTLCLAFMLASLLNANAQTYTLVGENINGKSWDVSATENDFIYDSSTDSYVITGVTMSDQFKVAQDHAWTTSWGTNGKKVPTDAAYICWKGSGENMSLVDSQTYTNCTVRFKILDSEAASVCITSDTSMSGSVDTQASQWCIAGVFADGEHWDDTNVMTDLGNGVYEWWCETLPTEFKFKGAGSWDYNFGIPKKDNVARYTPIMHIDNALDNNGDNIKITNDEYDKYRIVLAVRGYVGSFRIEGYNEAVPTLSRVFYESFDQNVDGTGGNDGNWSGSVASGTWDSAIFDVAGWTAVKGFYANKCIKLGTGSVLGSATTPALGVTGNAELRFRAGAWNGDATTLNVTINNGGTLSTTSVTLVNNEFTDYTISIADATAESTITFSATKASKNRFFLDEVEIYAVNTPLKSADITMTDGLMKDATTVYYNRNIAIPTYKVTLPAGATSMDIEVSKDDYVETISGQTADYTLQIGEVGNFTIRAIAYGDGVYSVASKEVVVEQMNSYYGISEFFDDVAAGNTEVGYLNFSPKVTYQNGRNLYIEYNNEGGLVFGNLDRTYNPGDILVGFPVKSGIYGGNYQFVPLVSDLGAPYSTGDAKPLEIEAGEEWTAFANNPDNLNRYVLVKNAVVTSSTVGGINVYTNTFGVTMPEDLTKNYDVECIVSSYKSNVQVLPISFTEYVDPNTYTLALNVNPESGATVSALDKIVFTPGAGVIVAMATDEALTQNWFKVTDAEGNSYNSTLALESGSSGYGLTIEGATASGTYTVVVPKKSFYDALNKTNFNDEITLTYTVEAAPVDNTVYDFTVASVSPKDGSEVESLSKIYITFNYDDDIQSRFAAANKGWIIVKDANGAEYDAYMDDNWDGYAGDYIIYVEGATAAGTYTVTIPKGTVADSDYMNKEPYYLQGHANPEIVLTYTLVEGQGETVEFTVPAGIDGYINYDDSDANAWAPEFPFSISTNPTNSIQLTATLPSLPTGLTAMEVVDENNEVVITLSQAGIAPLNDGAEEYIVSGQTTKEYADGAEFKFRFRFTHATGTTETIQFCYVVGGGSITGIESVQLSDNVIVRGNTIIAPEGSAIFTVAGVRVASENLAPGVYVVVNNKQAVKVMVK